MRSRLRSIIGCGVVIAGLIGSVAADLDPLDQWAQWRGPLANGVAPRGNPPVEWSEQRNIRWKTALPGAGQSTPVVWGDRIYLTTAVATGDRLAASEQHAHGAHDNAAPTSKLEFTVLALDRDDGKIVWQRVVHSDVPHDSAHESGTWASNSAVTDGKRVFASFGSAGIFALDRRGRLVWQADLGDMQIKHGHGEGSSPALHGKTLIVNWDHEGASFLIALDTRSGKELWKVAREEGTSWSTPLIVEHGGRQQVIVAATRRVRAYDLADGKLIWECGGLSGNVVASPVAADGRVFVGSSYETRAMLAIDLNAAKGDITGTDAVLWTRDRDTPYVPSPVLYDGALCFLKHYQGLLTCVDAPTGKLHYGPVRVPGIRNVYASPAAAAGRLYVVDRSGNTAVVRHAAEFEVLSVNHLDDVFSASPAIVGDTLLLRGERFLYSIEATPLPAAE